MDFSRNYHALNKIISFVVIRMIFFSCFEQNYFICCNKNGFFSCFEQNYLIRMDFSRNYHTSNKIISFVVIRMIFFHASNKIISFVVIRMIFFSCFEQNYFICCNKNVFFSCFEQNYLIRMDFSRNYHASNKIISFVVIRMYFLCKIIYLII